MHLLAKLDTLQVNPTQNISSDDQEAVNRIHTQYQEKIAELERFTKTLTNFDAQTSWAQSTIGDLSWDVRREREELDQNLSAQIISYFNGAHNLNLADYDYNRATSKEDRLNPTHTINWILNQLEGASFTDKAVELLRERVRQEFGRATLKNNLLTIRDFITPYEMRGYDELRPRSTILSLYPGSESTFSLLADALAHALDHTKTSVPYYNDIARTLTSLYENIREHTSTSSEAWGQTHPVGTASVESVVLYKNGNLRLRFTSAEAAQRFATLYNLTLN